jgi:hypothetical protein
MCRFKFIDIPRYTRYAGYLDVIRSFANLTFENVLLTLPRCRSANVGCNIQANPEELLSFFHG